MDTSWLVLLPPLIVVIAAFITKEINPSLVIGLISASLIVKDGNPIAALAHSLSSIVTMLMDIENIYLYIFLIAISILIILLERTGGALAFAHALTTKLRSSRMTETSSLLMSVTLFIDDYLSILAVGYVMRPITDRFKLPRAKLAFLIHTLSSPLVILVPISSWVAMITANLEQAGVTSKISSTTTIASDPFSIYLKSIPFIFYSVLVIISAWFIVRRRISFGPMHTQEYIAQTTGNLFGNKRPIARETGLPEIHESSSVLDTNNPFSKSFSICFIWNFICRKLLSLRRDKFFPASRQKYKYPPCPSALRLRSINGWLYRCLTKETDQVT